MDDHMMNPTSLIREYIEQEKEASYRLFSMRLLPGVADIEGVRLPKLHRLVKHLLKDPLSIDWLRQFKGESFEETMVKGLLIGQGNWPMDEKCELIRDFLPEINNWSHCDTFCKYIKDVDATYLPLLKEYTQSRDEFTQRFVAVMLLEHFASPEYLDTGIGFIQELPLEDYYAKMSVAWYLSVIYFIRPDKVILLLKYATLNTWTKKKTVQKIKESKHLTSSQKVDMDNMKHFLDSIKE